MRPKHSWYSKLVRKCHKIRVNLTKPLHPILDSEIGEKVEEEKRLVIQVPFGGLGDHLMYSSLPELLWKQKGIKTFISDKSIFRSRAIRDFVWGLNPYVTFTDEKGWWMYKPLDDFAATFDEYLQRLFHLDGQGGPKVYYEPRIVEDVRGKNVIDPSFGPSGRANGYYEAEFRKRLIKYIESSGEDFILVRHSETSIKGDLERCIERTFRPICYDVGTIEELADVLFSAKQRYLLFSGAASLSAAMGLRSIVVCYWKAVPKFQYAVNTYIELPGGD
ncbi:MAG: hypothetical protein AMJ75_08390 [Phycisphaerae bacterium SM1_79]|nr:MAG: hypothetical protein AMJ75_08390 [Phycisphaerae bacterium SM1_79]